MRPSLRLAALGLVLLLGPAAGCAGSPPESAVTMPSGASVPPPPATPPRLGLELGPLPAVLPAGSPLSVVARVRNQGPAPVEFAPAGDPSPIAYRISRADGALVHEVAQREYLSRSAGGVTPPEPAKTPFAPGEVRAFTEDLAAYLPAPLAAGSYRLEAVVYLAGAKVVSAPVAFSIGAGETVGFARVTDADVSRFFTATIVAAPRENGGRVLVSIGSETHPAGAAAQTIHALSPGAPVEGCALAAPAVPASDQHWLAWLRGDRVAGGLARAHDLAFPFETAPIPLGRAELFPGGVQVAGRRGWFAAYGAGEKGARAVAIVEVNLRTPPVVRVVRLENAPSGRPSAQWFAAEGAAPMLRLVWFENLTGGGRLSRGEIALDSNASAATVAAGVGLPGRVVASVVPALDAGTGSGIAWLEATGAAGQEKLVLGTQPQWSVDGAGTRVALPAPPAEVAPAGPMSWLLAEGVGESPTVWAITGGRAWFVGAAGWSAAIPCDAPSPRSRLFSLANGQLWLSNWIPGQPPELRLGNGAPALSR